MCLAVRGGQGWSDSLSSDFHLLIGRRGGERSVGPCNLLLVLSLFVFCSSQTSVFFPPLLSSLSLSLSLASTTGVSRLTVTWIVVLLHKYMLIQMYWIQLSYPVFCLTLQDGVETQGGKGVRRLWLSLHVYFISYQRYFASSCLMHQHKCFWLKRKKLIWSLGTSGFHPLSFSYANSLYLTNSGISWVCVYMSVYQGPCYKNQTCLPTSAVVNISVTALINVLSQLNFAILSGTLLWAWINNL